MQKYFNRLHTQSKISIKMNESMNESMNQSIKDFWWLLQSTDEGTWQYKYVLKEREHN